jgi:hypothetical protein
MAEIQNTASSYNKIKKGAFSSLVHKLQMVFFEVHQGHLSIHGLKYTILPYRSLWPNTENAR